MSTKCEMKSPETPIAKYADTMITAAERTTRVRAVGIHRATKVCTQVISDRTVPYRFSALWLITDTRNNTSSIGPSAPVVSATPAITSSPGVIASATTAPNANGRIEPRVQPREVATNVERTTTSARTHR